MRYRIGRALLLAGAAVVSVPFAAGYLLPQHGFLLIALASFAGYSLLGLALIEVMTLAARQWRMSAAFGVLLILASAVLGPAYLPDGPKHGTPIVVMSANVYFGKADLSAVVTSVRDRHVDLLAIEELTPSAVQRLRAAGLELLLPYSALHDAPSARGAGLWSKRPLTSLEPWPSTFRGAAADVDVDGVLLRVRVVHPPPPVSGGVGTWERDYDGFLAAARSESSQHTLLMGDFNASVHHRRLRQLMGRRWRDAAALAGAGLVRTWGQRPGRPAVLDPDHVLVDRGMGVRQFAIVRIPGSDHRAVVATVLLPTRR